MWYGHHPFFLFLIPGLIGEKFEKEQVKKQMREEKALQEAIELQNKEAREIRCRLSNWKESHEQTRKKAKPHFRRLGISTFILLVSLCVGELPAILAILCSLSVVGIIVFGVISFAYYSELENSSSVICQLEDELKRRTKLNSSYPENYTDSKIQMSEYNEYLGSGKDL